MSVLDDLFPLRSMHAAEIAAQIRILSTRYAEKAQNLQRAMEDSDVTACLMAILIDEIVSFPDASVRARRIDEFDLACTALRLDAKSVKGVSASRLAAIVSALDE